MEQNVRNLWLRWNLLRLFAAGIISVTNLLIVRLIPGGWWLISVPALAIGFILTALAVTQWRVVWIYTALLVEAFLFTLALAATVFGFVFESYVPALLIAFTLILVSEHTLTTTASYSSQFSNQGDPAVLEFNFQTLSSSLKHLFRHLARDNLILATGFLISVAVVSLGAVGPAPSILSDPSLYMVIAAISLAGLLTMKES